MRESTKFLMIGLVCLILVGCDRQGPQLVHPDVLGKAGMQYYWQLQLKLDDGESLSRISLLDENLYCLTDRHCLIAVDAAVGKLKWFHTVAAGGQKVFSPSHINRIHLPEKVPGMKDILSPENAGELDSFNAVLLNTVSYVLLFDRSNGKLYRKIPFAFAANTSGVSDEKYFYVASVKGWYYAIRLREAVEAWRHSADDMVRAAVKYFGKHIYLADEAGTVIATKVENLGEKVWNQKLGGAVTADFHVGPRGCFLPCDDHRIYAFDSLSGKELWDPFTCQGPLRDTIQVAENTIFQFARGDKFYAINLTTGKERWSLVDGRTVLATFDGEVYLLNSNNTLLIVDEILGTVRTTLPMSGWDLLAANISAPAVYAATHDGKLACIRKISAGTLTPEMLK